MLSSFSSTDGLHSLFKGDRDAKEDGLVVLDQKWTTRGVFKPLCLLERGMRIGLQGSSSAAGTA